MEEEKVGMSGNQTPENEVAEQPQKFTYEQLVEIASQLQQQNNELQMRLQQIGGIESRLHYLFKVVENRTAFDSDFIISVTDEIKRIMIIKEETSEQPASESEPQSKPEA